MGLTPDADWHSKELRLLHRAAELARLDSTDCRLASRAARLIWKLPACGAAVAITRPGGHSLDLVTGQVCSIQAARAAGVRTPALLTGPLTLPGRRYALVFEWVDGVTQTSEETWPHVAEQAARLADVPLRPRLPRLELKQVSSANSRSRALGTELARRFAGHWETACASVNRMMAAAPLALCHGDLQPANCILDNAGRTWLIDWEYSCIAPMEWDPAKLVILAHRFGEPANAEPLLAYWPAIHPDRLADCVTAQETL
ncbi:MAG: phosphotransferase family protein, partial [Pseudonocardiaceae bacterium]